MVTYASSVVGGATVEGWFESVNRMARHTPWLHTPATAFAKYGVVLFAALLLVSWLLARRGGEPARVAAALWAPVGALLALALNQPIGSAVAERRPYAVLPHVEVLVARTTDFSFPSDHAVMAGAAAAGVLLVHRRLGLATAALAVLMAFTRVYVGAHFPVDVLAGLVVGAAVVVASWFVVRRPVQRVVARMSETRLRPLVAAGAQAGG